MVSRRIKQFGTVVVKGDLVGKQKAGFEKLKEEVEEVQEEEKCSEDQEQP
jgi:hypothetical protein